MHIMKYYFLGSLIPLSILFLHSLKNYSNVFFPIYLFIYMFHLSGRPHRIGVINWYRAQRMAELVLLLNFSSLYACFIAMCTLTLVYKNIHLASLYAMILAFAGRNPLLSVLLLFVIILHDLPFDPNEFSSYFHVRMAKNFILFAILWMDSSLYWSSLCYILMIVGIYYTTHGRTTICMEYFTDPIPIIYPIPLDVKDAIAHCPQAKVLFKIHVL